MSNDAKEARPPLIGDCPDLRGHGHRPKVGREAVVDENGTVPFAGVIALMAAWREALAAWTVWALMLAAGVWFVAAHAFTMPYGDEWEWLPVVAGQAPASPAWLWSLHNEHRLVLARLAYLGLGRLTAFDFRAGSVFNLFLLAALAAAMMLSVRALRGRTSVYDAFFPLLLLHWAQCENIVWGFQLNFTTSVALVGAILVTIAHCGRQVSIPSALVVTVCLIGLGLSGLYGLAYLPAMACWLLFVGVTSSRHAPCAATANESAVCGRHTECACYRPLLIALACIPMALVALNFIGFHLCNDRPPDIWASVRTALQFLSSGIGPAAKEIWPVSGVLIAVACSYAIWQLITVFVRQPHERIRAAGLFCFLGGIGSLAVAIGVGRAFAGPRAGFMERYMTLAAPLLCLFYCQFTLYSSKAKIHLQRTLCLLMLGLMVVNVHKGLRYARYFDHLLGPLEADMRAGLSPGDLAMRHGEDLGFAPEEVFAARLEMLARARLGPYRDPVEPSNLTVQRLSRLAPSREPSESKCLLPGQRVAQHFDVPAGASVARIDVQISRCRGRRTAERLDWELRLAAPGEPRVLSHGSIDMRTAGRNDYVSLTIHDSALRTPTEGWSGERQGARISRLALGFAGKQVTRDSVILSAAKNLGGSDEILRCAQDDNTVFRQSLVFSLPPDTPAECGVELPLYRCTEATEPTLEIDAPPQEVPGLSLKGFVYLGHDRVGHRRTTKSGDWSIFRRENVSCQETVGRKHGPVPFVSGFCSFPGVGQTFLAWPLPGW